MISDTDALRYEVAIVWDTDIEQFDYVRVMWVHAHRRQHPIPWHSGRRIGYSVLAADAPNVGHACEFKRRVFYLASHDRGVGGPNDAYARGGAPHEGVDPRTVAPGVAGVRNERAWGGPLTKKT